MSQGSGTVNEEEDESMSSGQAMCGISDDARMGLE